MIDAANPADSNIGMKEHENIEKSQVLKEQLEQMWRAEAKLVIGATTSKPEECLQQLPGLWKTSDVIS